MPDPKNPPGQNLSEQQIRGIATEAYLFGYPLVMMDMTRQLGTNVPKSGQNAAPLNQFGNMRSFPDATFTTVVSPNADTLYSFAFLDVSQEPIVLSVPEMGNRYYLMQMLDGWTNVFAAPGTRTTGSAKGDFAVTGPLWKGTLPAGVKEIKSPTSMVWIIGRTQTNGKGDFAAVNDIQNKYKLTPLSSFGKSYTVPENVPVDPSVDMKAAPVDQVNKMDAATFFTRLNALMKSNPPAPADAEAIKRFAQIGVAPGKSFDLQGMDSSITQQIVGGVRDGLTRISSEARKSHGKNSGGWEFMLNVGRYGTDYLWRAVVALIGLGANIPEDAIYPRSTKDADGKLLNGANQYVVHFPKGQLPPVGAFWSITMYNDRQFFVPNPIDRYAIGDRDKLTFNADGSLTLYLQNESPGKDKESNWLPAPEESFNLLMRLYWPKKEILDGVWNPPKIERKDAEARKVA
jgi:hypothetical protein